MSITLGSREISRNGNEVYVIAEIGQNHQGSLSMAKNMILEAKAAGASCVKFQKSCLSAKFTSLALNRRYDSPNSWGLTYGDHKRFLEFELDEYKELQRYSTEIGIDFTASAMDEVSLDQLDSLNVPFIKIGSGDTNNFAMLEKAVRLKRPLIISTGMQHMSVIDQVVRIMKSAGKHNFSLLHCVSAYPAAPSDCGLQFIRIFKQKYPDIVIGYSGHELGIDISIAAVILGARIIERHFTLDKSLKGSDHKCSLTPDELKRLIQRIDELKSDDTLIKNQNLDLHKVAELAGNSVDVQSALKDVKEKIILPCEESCKAKLGKSIVAAKNLKCGHKLEMTDLWIKVSEPNGIPAEQYYELLEGATLKMDVLEDCPISDELILRKTKPDELKNDNTKKEKDLKLHKEAQ